jgi:DNA-binding MarR family transcriptional regulator
MKLTPGSFSIVPIKMLSGLPANEQVVFMWLCSYANQKNQCFPSISTLCKKTSLSKNSILKSLKSLEERGYMKIH